MPADLTRFRFWASHTLVGTLVVYQLVASLPLFAVFTYLNYTNGALTVAWTVRTAVVCVLFGVFGALYMWFTFSRWLVYLHRDTTAMKARLAKIRGHDDEATDNSAALRSNQRSERL